MLEYAVRPYQTPNSQGKIIIPSTPGATNQRATITWGSQASNVPQPELGKDFTVICCSEELREVNRLGEYVRIYNKDDHDQFVDVFRARKLFHTKPKNNPCDSPLDQALGQSFGLDDGGDMTIDLGFAGTVLPEDKCKVTWNLNNNTTGA